MILDNEQEVGTNLSRIAAQGAAALLTTTLYITPASLFTEPVSASTVDHPYTATTIESVPGSYLDLITETETVQYPRWATYVAKRLSELREGVYDYTGLQVPSEFTVDRAVTIANETFGLNTPTPSVVPSEDGDVLFVWHKRGWDFEIEVGPKETFVWAHNRDNGSMWSGSLAERQSEVSDLLDSFAQE